MTSLIFDGNGNSIPPGGPSIDAIDLSQWPGCRMVIEIGGDSDPAIITFVPDGATTLPPIHCHSPSRQRTEARRLSYMHAMIVQQLSRRLA